MHQANDVILESLQVGFLYCRYLQNPRKIWEWIEGYLGDREVRRSLLFLDPTYNTPTIIVL